MGKGRIAMSPENVNRGLAGLRLLSLESRRADQMARLIENHGGVALVAPSMREIPLKENSAALAFAEDLFAGKFDAVIFLTGVGVRILFGAVETKHPRERLTRSGKSWQSPTGTESDFEFASAPFLLQFKVSTCNILITRSFLSSESHAIVANCC